MHASPSPSHALARVLSVWRRATAAADTSATSARALLAHALLLLDHSDTADAPRVADTLQRALVASGNAVRAHAASADEHAVLSIVAALVLHASASPRDAVAHDDAHAHDDDAWSLRRAVLAEAVMATQQHVSAAAAQALVTLLDALTVAAHADDAHALALARERAALHRALGTALAYANRLAEAQEALARALQHTPHDGDLLIDMGAILQLQGHARDAVQYFARAATLGASMGYMLAARALDDAGLLAEALPYYLRARTVAIEVDEFRAAGHAVERALDELSVRAVDAALARLEARIASAPDAGGGAGVSSGGADAPAAAAAAAADAPATTTGVVAVDVHADEATQHAQLHHNAMKLSDAARYDDALAVFDELLARIGPLSAADGSKRTDAAPFINRALTLSRAGRSNEAAPLLREVVRVEPQNGVAWFNLANALMDTGVWHEARDAYERAAALLPDNPTAASSLARWYMAQNRNVEAAQLFREAVQRHPDYHGHWVNLGITLKELSYLEDAREAFERAVALAPDDAVTWYNLGSVYKDAQRFAESRHAYAQALRLRGHDFAEAFTEMVHSMFWVCDWTDYASNMRTFARLLATSDETRVARLVQPFYTLITPVRLGIVLKASRAYAERTYRQCAGAMPGAPGPAAVPPAHALFAHGRGARASARVVRVGFMSSDLRTHAVGRQLSTLFEYLVADNGPAAGLVDAVAFHTQPTDDSVWAKRIDAALGPARQRTIDETASVTDAARTIARERVDILLNLNGHTKYAGGAAQRDARD